MRLGTLQVKKNSIIGAIWPNYAATHKLGEDDQNGWECDLEHIVAVWQGYALTDACLCGCESLLGARFYAKIQEQRGVLPDAK
jgi:hypothetical protein